MVALDAVWAATVDVVHLSGVCFGATVDFVRFQQWRQKRWIISGDFAGCHRFAFRKIPTPAGSSARSTGCALERMAICLIAVARTVAAAASSNLGQNLWVGGLPFCISLIAAADGCMIKIRFADVRKTLCLAASLNFGGK